MDVAVRGSSYSQPPSITFSRNSFFVLGNREIRFPTKTPTRTLRFNSASSTNCSCLCSWRFQSKEENLGRLSSVVVKCSGVKANGSFQLGVLDVVLKRGLVLVALILCGGLTVLKFRSGIGVEGFVSGGFLEQSGLLLRSFWPKVLLVLGVFKDQGLLLLFLFALSAFFSMAETSITTLWPWKVRELAEKESENGVFKMLQSDITRFLTTILIGTTVANIGATALITDAATAIFGQAGVTAATGVMTVAVLLLTEITPKSIAVNNATEVARFVVRPVAWLSLILYPVGRVVTYLSMGILKVLGLKGRSEPYVTEDELKLMLRGAEMSGAIEEEEQDMIENVLEIKDTYVKEVMTPLVDVVAIDASATLVDFHSLWVTHQYSRIPVFEQRVDNIVGVAYAMELLEYVQKGELLESTAVVDVAHKPAYFVPDSMSVWNLLREFRIRKVHMAVVLNEYGGTIGIVTLEDVVEEIVGEIFDENDSKYKLAMHEERATVNSHVIDILNNSTLSGHKIRVFVESLEEIEKKTGYIVMRAEGVYDVDANTSIYHLSEDLNIKMPEDHQYETVSGFICEAFGYIPRTGETIQVVLEKANHEDHDEGSDRQNQIERNQHFKLEILAGNARKVGAIRFEQISNDDRTSETEAASGLVPKIVKRKKNDYEDVLSQRIIEYSDDLLVTEHDDNHERTSNV